MQWFENNGYKKNTRGRKDQRAAADRRSTRPWEVVTYIFPCALLVAYSFDVKSSSKMPATVVLPGLGPIPEKCDARQRAKGEAKHTGNIAGKILTSTASRNFVV